MSSSQQFAGKVIAITGAASGIGLETARLLASRGASLSLADIQKEALEKVQAELQADHKAGVIIFPIDVRKYDEVEAWITGTVKHFGKLDGAANLAGVIPKSIGVKEIKEQDPEEWDFVIGVNQTGVMHCLKAQLSTMNGAGSIVNASSIAGNTGRGKNAAYSASKHAVIGLSRSAAKEVGPRGIRVNAICPGRIATPMAKQSAQFGGEDSVQKSAAEVSDVALRRVGQPQEVATLIAFLLSDESTYISGADIAVDGGWRC